MKSLSLVTILVLLLSGIVSAEVITVALVGGDYDTIHDAVDAANDEDTVMVLSDYYIFTVEQGAVTIDKQLAIIGAGYDGRENGGTTIFAPGQVFNFTTGSDESRLEGFRLQGAGTPMVAVSAPDIVVEKNMFQNRYASNYSLVITAARDTVRNNIFTNGTNGEACYGLGVSGTTNALVNNNLFGSVYEGILTNGNTNLKIVNNILVNVGNRGIGNGYYANNWDNANIHANIFMNCGTAVANRSGSPTVSYNAFHNNTTDYSGQNLEPVLSNPLFVDYGNSDVYNFESYDEDGFDFHLQSGSPCIDAGPPQEEWYDIDPGSGGLRNDMGIYGYAWPIGDNGAPTIPVVNTLQVSPATVSPSGTITIEATGRIGD